MRRHPKGPTRHHDRYAQAADDFFSKASPEVLEAEAKKKLIANSPLNVPRIDPETIAPVVVFLASDEAYMVSSVDLIASYNVLLSLGVGNHVDLRGLPGGAEGIVRRETGKE